MSLDGPEPEYYAKRMKMLRKTIKSLSGGYSIQSDAAWQTLLSVVLELRRLADNIESDVKNAMERDEKGRNGG